MTTGEVRFASLAFLAMMLTVALNLFALQGGTDVSGRLGGRRLAVQPANGVLPAVNVAQGNDGAAAQAAAAEQRVATGALPAVNSAELTRGIQRELNARGYDAGPPDGVVGLVTRSAIMAYEFDNGMRLTAAPSQALLSRIILGTTSSHPGQGASRGGGQQVGADAESVIRNVQAQLTALGYKAGEADGKLSDQLARAIRAFEIDQKLKETGRISGPLVSRLVRLQVDAARGSRSGGGRR